MNLSMSKYYLEDSPRERNQSIEKSPSDYYPLQEKVVKKDAQNTSEIIKKKFKKNHSKSDKSAMAEI